MIKTRIKEYNIEMSEIIDDFNQYCYVEKLISNTKLRVVNATSSLIDNQKYNLYYCPVSYNLGFIEFFWLSSNKSVRYIGKILKIIDANNLDNETPSFVNFHGSDATTDEKFRIREAYKSALNFNEKWDISNNHRFYIVDKFEETDFKKTSKYIFQQSKIFELEDYINVEKNKSLKNLNSKQIADYLRNKTWE